MLGWEQVGSFAPTNVGSMAVRNRLLRGGTDDLQRLHQQLGQLLQRQLLPDALPLAPFAKEVVALDETTLDRLRRLTEDLQEQPEDSDQVQGGKLAGLFDLRQQQWVRLELRSDVLANCKVNVLLLLEGVAVGSLILADVGYFSFPWFDYLTQQGYYWVSRLRAGTCYELIQVLYQDGETLEAIVWLGADRADRAAYAVRLVQFRHGEHLHGYLTNVLDPEPLSLHDLVQLSARSFDIELAIKLLKGTLGLHFWWSAVPVLVLQQIWIALIAAQLLQALRLAVAQEAQVDPFEVSIDVLAQLLAQPSARPGPLIPTLVRYGQQLGLLRPSTRTQVITPALDPSKRIPLSCEAPLLRRARYAQRGRSRPPRLSHPPRFSDQLLI
jgi:hypothetical protein